MAEREPSRAAPLDDQQETGLSGICPDAGPPFAEDEIRPDGLMAGQAARFAADMARLMQHAGEFVEVPCPACGSPRSRRVFEKYGVGFVTCIECETMFVNPRPTPDLLAEYYSTSENYRYWNEHIFPASETARRDKIFRPRVQLVADICERYGVPTGALLEVGGGFGTFCEEMVGLGLFSRVVVVEPTPGLAQTCRCRGLEVIEEPIENASFEAGSVDVVVSFEVIEHLFEPRAFVGACAAMLAPGGVFLLTCPNAKGFEIEILHELAGSVDPEHLNYFHPQSLSDLITSCGLEVIEVQTPGRLDAELVHKKALAGDLDLSERPFLKRVLVDEWESLGQPFQAFLAGSLLSAHMLVVARRPE
jgi:SAM-dependent methyltransferase